MIVLVLISLVYIYVETCHIKNKKEFFMKKIYCRRHLYKIFTIALYSYIILIIGKANYWYGIAIILTEIILRLLNKFISSMVDLVLIRLYLECMIISIYLLTILYKISFILNSTQ